MGGGLEALVQAATQERKRLSNDYANLQETDHPTAYSPNHDDYSLSAPVHGTAYSPELGNNLDIESPHESQRSSGSQLENVQTNVLDVAAQERLIQNRSSFMRISHIASDYHPTLHISPVASNQPFDLVGMTDNLEDLGDQSFSRASSAPPTESEPDAHTLESLEAGVPIAEDLFAQERPPSVPLGEEEEDGNFLGYTSDNDYSKPSGGHRHASPILHKPAIAGEGSQPSPASGQDIESYETEISPAQSASVLYPSSEQCQPSLVTPTTAEIDSEVASRPDAENDDMTVDMEFDLAASKSDGGFDMEIDVEDELLRLVDDEPSNSQRGGRESWRRSPSTPITDILLEIEAPAPTSAEPAPAVIEPVAAQQHTSEASGSKKSNKGTSSRKKQPAGKVKDFLGPRFHVLNPHSRLTRSLSSLQNEKLLVKQRTQPRNILIPHRSLTRLRAG
jgi:hypothetical protein